MTAKCCICKEHKEDSEFWADKRRGNGLSSRCKSCDSLRLLGLPKATVDRVCACGMAYKVMPHTPDSELCRRCRRTKHQREQKEKLRWQQRKSQYGIEKWQYDAMMRAQGCVCAICGRAADPSAGRNRRDLSVDHDHKTGVVRGLLCWRCNPALGFFEDDMDRLLRAISYLMSRRSPSLPPQSA